MAGKKKFSAADSHQYLTSRPDASMPAYCRRIPSALRLPLIGKTISVVLCDGVSVGVMIKESTQAIRLSMQTRNLPEAVRRARNVTAQLDAIFLQLARNLGFELKHRQIMALAGELYAGLATDPDSQPPEAYKAVVPELFGRAIIDFNEEARRLERLAAAFEELPAGQLDMHLAGLVDTLLSERGLIQIAPISRERLVSAFASVLPAALRTRGRYASGDYRPDAEIEKFPKWEALPGAPSRPLVKRGAYLSLTDLFASWWQEAQASGRSDNTGRNYETVVHHLARFLKHDDATRITREEMLRYKDYRLASISKATGKPIKAHSFRSSDLSALKAVFGWAAENDKLPSDPTENIRIKVTKSVKVRDRNFTPEETRSILGAAESWRQVDRAFYWVPWLCAYSGCRVGEAIQLRKEDIRQAGGTWVFKITPEAGTVKGKEAREVPVHLHLLELGFVDFRNAAEDGHLFVTPGERGVMPAVRGKIAELRQLVRQIVSDPNVGPNHGWRHTFKSIGFEAGIQEKVLDAICGHMPVGEGRKYGGVTLKTKVDAMAVFPRYKVG